MIGFGIVGGDRRQIYLARSLAEDGHLVLAAGMERAEDVAGLQMAALPDLAEHCGVIVLPLPATRDGAFLNAPYAAGPVPLDDGFARLLIGKRVFGGMLSKLAKASPLWQGVDCRDYYEREELITGNAFLTAEAAVALAVTESPSTLGGARCLVTGFGRIGKALCSMLRGMGAQVSCAARKPADLAAIRANGYQALTYEETAREFDAIFNTVPAGVVGQETLACQRREVLLMELASSPGGFDRAAVGTLGLRVLEAASLPGRFSPKAAGELIKMTLYHMLEGDTPEEHRERR